MLPISDYHLLCGGQKYASGEIGGALDFGWRKSSPQLLEATVPGKDGLDLTRIILREARRHLNPDGLLVVEIGHNRAELEAAYPALPFTWLDTAAGDRFRVDELELAGRVGGALPGEVERQRPPPPSRQTPSSRHRSGS